MEKTEKNYIKLTVFNTPAEAHIIKNMLEGKGIEAFIQHEDLNSLSWGIPVNEALVELWVEEDKFEEARALLETTDFTNSPEPDYLTEAPVAEEQTEKSSSLLNSFIKIFLVLALFVGGIYIYFVLFPTQNMLITRAYKCAIEEKYEESNKYVTQLLEKEKGNDEYYHLRGDNYRMLKEYDKALVDLNKALQIKKSPANFEARALLYSHMELYDKALDDINQILESQKDGYSLGLRADIYLEMKLYDKAIRDYSRALILKPNADSFAWRGDAYAELESYEDAISDYTEALALKKDPYYYTQRGYAHAYSGLFDNALQDMEKAKALKPELSEFYYNYACIFSLMKNQEKALFYLEQAINKGFNNIKHMEEDSDLDFIKQTKEYSALVKK